MTDSVDPQRVEDWNGSSGERWVVHQQWLDHMLHAFGAAAVDAAAPVAGEWVLDVGCGAGASSFLLADRVGAGGHVLGIDISEALVERARETAPAAAGVSFVLGDAARAPFPPDGFDLLFSRFGVMFFHDPVAAFVHLRGALKPDGRLVFVCWRGAQENDWITLPLGAIRDFVTLAPPSPGAPGPFSFGARSHVTGILEQAGFAEVGMAPFDHEIVFGRGASRDAAVADAVNMAFEVGPLSRALAGQGEAIRLRAADAVREAFARRAGENQVTIDGAAWIVTARNPR